MRCSDGQSNKFSVMSLKDSQKDMFEHSSKKVELLRLYLNAYLAVLGFDGFTDAIRCHDIFCGEGVYPNGGKGSPIVFAETLIEAALRNPSKRFSLHFNDQDADKVENVKKELSQLGQLPTNLVVTSSVLRFDQVIQETKDKLAQMGKEKAFLFVDPYGYKEIKPQLIQELMLSGKCELLLFLPTQQMFRFSKKGTPESLAGFLDEIRQGREFPREATISTYIAYIVEGFRLLMPDRIVDSFIIRKDSKTAFCLFFFTSNLKGAEKMLEAKWKLDDQQGVGWSYSDSGYEGSLFQEPQINTLEKMLEVMLKEGSRNNIEIYDRTIRAGFRPTHATQILRVMQTHGRIKVVENVRNGTFYLDYASTHGGDLSKRKIITLQLS